MTKIPPLTPLPLGRGVRGGIENWVIGIYLEFGI